VLAPTIVAIIGPRFAMFFSGILYRQVSQMFLWLYIRNCATIVCIVYFCVFFSGYIAVFIIPSTWSLYFTSVVIGIGAASK